MKPKSRRKPKAKQPVASIKIAVSACRWLLVVNEVPIRKAAMRDYLKSEKQIAKAREQLEAFESGDLPAFARWEAQTFGTLMSDLRELTTQIDAKRAILVRVTEEMMWSGCDEATAYRRVMNLDGETTTGREGEAPSYEDWDPFAGRTDDPDEEKLFGDSDLPEDFDIDEYDRWSPKRQRKFRESYEEEAEMFQIFEGRTAPDFDDLLERERRKRRGEEQAETPHEPPPGAEMPRPVHPAPPPTPADARIKELYRSLVRQLHPDMAGEQTDRERELWHQLQEAYRLRDLEWMEAIAGRIEVASSGAANLPLQILRRMIKELAQALQGIRSQVNQRRKHPAWEFRKKAAFLPRLEMQRRRELEAERQMIQEDLREMEHLLAELARRADRTVRRKKPGKKPANPNGEQSMFAF